MPIPKSLPQIEGATAQDPSSSDTSSSRRPSANVKLLSDRYTVGDKLGSGNFGTVYLVDDIKTGERKVLKRINIGEIQPDETIEAVKEATLLAKLDHPAIVKFHDSFVDQEFFCIVTEYCEGGDLDNLLKQFKQSGKTLNESLVLDWFVQLTNAVRYIHDRKVLHRDLKTRNIFLKDNNIKLGDFGISRILVGTSDYATTFTGTPYYMSPEVLKQDGYNVKSDIWSLGAVLYELCTCEHAFQGNNLMAVMYKIVEGHPPRLPDHFSTSLQYLYTRMMDKVPERRPSAIEILQDHYIKQHMETLSQKLSLTLSLSAKSNATEEAKAIATALKEKKREDIQKDDKPLTPRQKMLHRKTKKADLEGEKLKQAAAANYMENQKRIGYQKLTKKTKIVPPWVIEHPEVFDSFSVTAIDDKTKDTSDLLNVSVMELSIEPVEQQQTNDVPGELMTPDEYQFDDFEMDISSCSDIPEENDFEAILHSINEAINLPEQKGTFNYLNQGVSPVAHESLFPPLARERRIAQLRNDAERILGKHTFLCVYEYLKMARSDDSSQSEAEVITGLRGITDNVRDCFLVDQIVFLEKQTEDI